MSHDFAILKPAAAASRRRSQAGPLRSAPRRRSGLGEEPPPPPQPIASNPLPFRSSPRSPCRLQNGANSSPPAPMAPPGEASGDRAGQQRPLPARSRRRSAPKRRPGEPPAPRPDSPGRLDAGCGEREGSRGPFPFSGGLLTRPPLSRRGSPRPTGPASPERRPAVARR